MIKDIWEELKRHLPHTSIGVVSGIILIFFFYRLPQRVAFNLFYTFHPLHVIFSAMATASLYKIHRKGKEFNIWLFYLIGYTGVVFVATISDSIIPYIGETLLNLPNRGIHIGFIEKWYLINPLAIFGVIIAYFWTRSKFPHFVHVLLSTWASLFHIINALGGNLNWISSIVIIIFLFIAVWIPACGSDIVYPMLFIGKEKYKE